MIHPYPQDIPVPLAETLLLDVDSADCIFVSNQRGASATDL